jgi:hypothetical protein
VWEIGSGYFGCRDAEGKFDPEKFKVGAHREQVRMIEIKLSQGAKPGHGGVLPAAKVTAEIAATRGVPMGQDCISPAQHSAFTTPIELLQFVQRLRELSGGKPTGFKLAIGHPWEWFGIAKAMHETQILPDFIVVDGAEGGTGAAPSEFVDHVGVPMHEALLLVHNTLVGLDLREPHRDRGGGAHRERVRHRQDDGDGGGLVQCGARFHVRAGLHPVVVLPYRSVSDRGGDAGSFALEGAGPGGQGDARAQLPPEHVACLARSVVRGGADASAGVGAGAHPAPRCRRRRCVRSRRCIGS